MKPKTLYAYAHNVKLFLAFLEGRGKRRLIEASTDDVAAWLVEREGRGDARVSVSLKFLQLRRVYAWLEQEGSALRNPAAAIERKHATSPLKKGLSETEVLRLLEALDATDPVGLRDRAITEVLYSSGLRCGELVALELDDLDLAEGFVSVRESKTGAGRVVPLGQVACGYVVRYLAEGRPALLRRPTLTVFLGERSGEAIHNEIVRLALVGSARRAGLTRKVHPHLLRHTFALHLLRHGASTREVQAMLGHRALDSTQRYTTLEDKDVFDAILTAHPRGRMRIDQR